MCPLIPRGLGASLFHNFGKSLSRPPFRVRLRRDCAKKIVNVASDAGDITRFGCRMIQCTKTGADQSVNNTFAPFRLHEQW